MRWEVTAIQRARRDGAVIVGSTPQLPRHVEGQTVPHEVADHARLSPAVSRVALTCAGIGSLIAATSLQHDFTVVTRNADDRERCGVRCFNPSVGM
jgi:hypothetical protein